MLRGNWRFLFTAFGCVIIAGLLWAALKPAYPVLPRYKQTKEEQAENRPGGARCEPSALARLASTERLKEGERCAEAAEQHYLQRSDLIQQARAADSASEAVFLSYGQSLMMLAGTIIGFLTLVAAFTAAFFAKRASDEAKRGADYTETGASEAKRAADSAERALEAAKVVSAIELRPWLVLSLRIESPIEVSWDRTHFEYSVIIKNVGSTPARDITLTCAGWGKGSPSSMLPDGSEVELDGIDVLPNEEIARRVRFKTNEHGGAIFAFLRIVVGVTYDIDNETSDTFERIFSVLRVDKQGQVSDGFQRSDPPVEPIPPSATLIRVEARARDAMFAPKRRRDQHK